MVISSFPVEFLRFVDQIKKAALIVGVNFAFMFASCYLMNVGFSEVGIPLAMITILNLIYIFCFTK